jgi:hypothetical protein
MPQDYEFEVTITAVVRVRAESEASAREVVVSSALASPTTEEIKLANQADFIMGKVGTVVSVDFSVEQESVKLRQRQQTIEEQIEAPPAGGGQGSAGGSL